MSALPVWHFFMQAVEGRLGVFAVALDNGSPAPFVNQPLSSTTEPNPALLAEFLDSDGPIPAEVCDWLADLLNDDGAGPMRLKPQGRGARRLVDDIGSELRSGHLASDTRRRFAELIREGKPQAPRLVFNYRSRGAPDGDGMANWEAAEVFEILTGVAADRPVGPSATRRAAEILASLHRDPDVRGAIKNELSKSGKLPRGLAVQVVERHFGIRQSSVTSALASLNAARKQDQADRLAEWAASEESRD
jgi:hypothetical protein